MEVVSLEGICLEKAVSNSPEDGFNRSKVTYIENEKEHTFHLLYVRFFEEQLLELTPFEQDPLLNVEGRDYYIRDIIGFVFMMSNPSLKLRDEVYLHDETALLEAFRSFNWKQLPDFLQSVVMQGKGVVRSPIEWVTQFSK